MDKLSPEAKWTYIACDNEYVYPLNLSTQAFLTVFCCCWIGNEDPVEEEIIQEGRFVREDSSEEG